MKVTIALVAMITLMSAAALASAQEEPTTAFRKVYSLFEIATVLIVAYVITSLLVVKNKISRNIHRKIWNTALLISFLVVGVLGILLILRINYGWSPFQHFFMLYYHVEAGIAMVVITLLHVYGRYFTCLFGRGKKCKT
jgi:hypothetical protein